MVAPLTELVSCAPLKRQLSSNTAAHGRVVLIAQRGQIAYHIFNATCCAASRHCARAMTAFTARVMIHGFACHPGAGYETNAQRSGW